MASRSPKSRWQNIRRAVAVIASVVALLTAIAGLIKISLEIGWLESKHDVERAASSTVESPQLPTKPPAVVRRDPKRTTTSSLALARSALPSPRQTAAAPDVVVDRTAFEITLPPKREYTIGGGISRGRFMLLGAQVTPETPESDELTIRWRFISRSPYNLDFRSYAFSLLVNNKWIRPERDFIHNIPSGESRDGDLLFVMGAKETKATLRIDYNGGNWEIPLDLTPAPAALSPAGAAQPADPTIPNRKLFDIALPARREYLVGRSTSPAGAFTLLAAKVTPQTPESDEISIHWRVLARGPYPLDFTSYDVWLDADGKNINPEWSFNHRIAVDDSREGDAIFIVEPGVRQAVLSIKIYNTTTTIPLDVSASAKVAASSP